MHDRAEFERGKNINWEFADEADCHGEACCSVIGAVPKDGNCGGRGGCAGGNDVDEEEDEEEAEDCETSDETNDFCGGCNGCDGPGLYGACAMDTEAVAPTAPATVAQTNDGREHCYVPGCGGKVKQVQGLTSMYGVCEKCGK
jgi:hypothetical protein